VKSALRSVIRLTTDLSFPPGCVHYGADGNVFCQNYERESRRLRLTELCRRCALPSAQDPCEACFLEPPPLDRAIHDAVTTFKYKDIRALAPLLGQLLADALPKSTRRSVDMIVPVPMSRSRLRHRGYNQSELLAQHLSAVPEDAHVPLESHILIRHTDSGSQANAQSHSERAANMNGAFEVPGEFSDEVTELRILLIDDLITTGSTLNACANVLKEAGTDWLGALFWQWSCSR
jgi:ComF family protein